MPATDAQRAAFRQRLGLALSEARTRLSEYTQQGIADELDVDRDTVGRWERGEREPKAFEVHWMAHLYKIDGSLFVNPPDSITELHLRIAELRRLAQEAAAAAAADAPGPPSDGGMSTPPGTSRPRKPPR